MSREEESPSSVEALLCHSMYLPGFGALRASKHAFQSGISSHTHPIRWWPSVIPFHSIFPRGSVASSSSSSNDDKVGRSRMRVAAAENRNGRRTFATTTTNRMLHYDNLINIYVIIGRLNMNCCRTSDHDFLLAKRLLLRSIWQGAASSSGGNHNQLKTIIEISSHLGPPPHTKRQLSRRMCTE